MDRVTFRLCSGDLRSKFGFEDGDLFWDWMLDNHMDAHADRELLVAVVKEHLIPRLKPPLEAADLDIDECSLHNPIRANWHGASDLAIDVSEEDVRDAYVRMCSAKISAHGLIEQAEQRTDGALGLDHAPFAVVPHRLG